MDMFAIYYNILEYLFVKFNIIFGKEEGKCVLFSMKLYG